MKLSLIVAMDQKRGIGKNNDLLWHLPADMRFFKETTLGHVVVMGRKNYESIPEKFRPLPGRENCVLTRNKNYKAADCLVFHSLPSCLNHYEQSELTVFIIGGAEIYDEALLLPELSEMYITQVKTELEADRFFPDFDESAWEVQKLISSEIDEKNKYAFEVFLYTKK